MAWLAEAPKPKRPTRSPGCVLATRRLRKPMMPAQRSGGDGVAGEDGVVAEVFFVAKTEGTGAVGAADPGDADACACWELRGYAFDGR
jgi:hypothetical protein